MSIANQDDDSDKSDSNDKSSKSSSTSKSSKRSKRGKGSSKSSKNTKSSKTEDKSKRTKSSGKGDKSAKSDKSDKSDASDSDKVSSKKPNRGQESYIGRRSSGNDEAASGSERKRKRGSKDKQSNESIVGVSKSRKTLFGEDIEEDMLMESMDTLSPRSKLSITATHVYTLHDWSGRMTGTVAVTTIAKVLVR